MPPSSPPFNSSVHAQDNKKHLLLCASGSVATIKIPQILHALSVHADLSIILVLTEAASRFLAGQSAEQPEVRSLLPPGARQYTGESASDQHTRKVDASQNTKELDASQHTRKLDAPIPNLLAIFRDADEWSHPWTRGAPILHIELRRWADVCVVAPLSANSMAGMVHGFSGNLLGSVMRAWDSTGEIEGSIPEVEIKPTEEKGPTGAEMFQRLAGRDPNDGGLRKRIVLAPAMNTAMWLQPVTSGLLKVLEGEWGVGWEVDDDGHGEKRGKGWVQVLRPKEGGLACGDVGIGAMADWTVVVDVIRERLELGEVEGG